MILGRRTKEPTICAICAREATGLGFIPVPERKRNPGGGYFYTSVNTRQMDPIWSCDAHVKHMRKVYAMTQAALNDIEKKTIDIAWRKVADAQLEAVVEALWVEKVRDLNDLTPEAMARVLDRMAIEGKGLAAAQKLLLAYAAEMQIVIEGERAPF